MWPRGGAGWGADKSVSEPGDPAEREADGAADALMAGHAPKLQVSAGAGIARQQAPHLVWGTVPFPTRGA